MATKIKIKNSVQAGKAPTPADLDRAELAINLADKKIYTKDASDAIIELGGGGGGKVDYASDAEVFDGTVTDKAISPEGLNSFLCEHSEHSTLTTNLPTTGAEIKFNGSVNFSTTCILTIKYFAPVTYTPGTEVISFNIIQGMTMTQVRDAAILEINKSPVLSATPSPGISRATGNSLTVSTKPTGGFSQSITIEISNSGRLKIPRLLENGLIDSSFLHPFPRKDRRLYKIGTNLTNNNFKKLRECFDDMEAYFNDPGGEVTIQFDENESHTWDTKSCFPRNVGEIIFESGKLNIKTFDIISNTIPTLTIPQIVGNLNISSLVITFNGINLSSSKGSIFEISNNAVNIKNCIIDNIGFNVKNNGSLIIQNSIIKNTSDTFNIMRGGKLYIEGDTTFDKLTGDIVKSFTHSKAFLSKNITYTNTTKKISHIESHIDPTSVKKVVDTPIPSLNNSINQLNSNDSFVYDEDYTGGGDIGPKHFIETRNPTATDGNDGDIWFKVT